MPTLSCVLRINIGRSIDPLNMGALIIADILLVVNGKEHKRPLVMSVSRSPQWLGHCVPTVPARKIGACELNALTT